MGFELRLQLGPAGTALNACSAGNIVNLEHPI